MDNSKTYEETGLLTGKNKNEECYSMKHSIVIHEYYTHSSCGKRTLRYNRFRFRIP